MCIATPQEISQNFRTWSFGTCTRSRIRGSRSVSGVRTTRDPIALLKKWLLEHQLCSDAEVKAIEKRMRAEVDAAVAFAKDAPQPPANELTADIYSGMKVDPRMCNL